MYIISFLVFDNLGSAPFTKCHSLFVSVNNTIWLQTIDTIKYSSKIFLTMAMAAIGLSTNLKDIKKMGYKPFVVGFIAMVAVGIFCILTIEGYLRFFV